MNDRFNWENLAKRLLSFMAMGGHLESDSGHIWIYSEDDEDRYFDSVVKKAGVSVNNKIYGGVLEALNVVDKALEYAGHPSLLDQWDEDYMFLGEDTFRENRLDRCAKGTGGLY